MIIIILAAVIALAAIAGAVIYIVMAKSAKKKAPVEQAGDADEIPALQHSEAVEPEPEAEPSGTEAEPEPAEPEHRSSLEPDKKDYFEGLFDDDEIK